MKLCDIAFFITVGTTFCIHVKNSMLAVKARRRVKKAIRKKGGDSVLWGWGWEFVVLEDPKLILRDSDDTELRNLKMDFINKWNEGIRGVRFTLIWLGCGLAITAVIGILESLF
jgi:hypothetical protein